MNALLFDCDGVLGETELHGHLPAFNQMWRELEIPWQWTPARYRARLHIAGGKERLASLLTDPDFVANVRPLPAPADLALWHRRKTAIFEQRVHDGCIPPRPGVRRLAAEALAAGWRVGIGSTSAVPSVAAMARHAFGPDLAPRIPIVAGDMVSRKKPDPEVYITLAARLDTAPADCLVVEDSAIGLAAALAAGMRCVITISEMTRGESFRGAGRIVENLDEFASLAALQSAVAA